MSPKYEDARESEGWRGDLAFGQDHDTLKSRAHPDDGWPGGRVPFQVGLPVSVILALGVVLDSLVCDGGLDAGGPKLGSLKRFGILDSTPLSSRPDMSMAIAVIVFLSVAITVAGMAYWILYIRKPLTPRMDDNASMPERPPVLPPPLATVSTPVAVYCPVCGFQNSAGVTMCACGYNLATVQMPAFPYSPAGPAAAGSATERRSRNGWAIFDEQSAQKAARQGMWGAFLVAIITAAVAVLAGSGVQLVKGVGGLAWIDAAVFAFLGMGIKNMNRAAAVGALVLYVVEQVALSQYTGFNPAMIGMVLCFAQGVRGTFAFHKYQEQSSYRTFASGMAPPTETIQVDE